MFKIATKRTVKWPVIVDVPQDGGTSKTERFTCEFEILDQSVIDARLADPRGNDIEFLSSVINDWDGVVDEKMQIVPCHEETKRSLLDIPYVRAAALRAYFDAVSGGRRKN